MNMGFRKGQLRWAAVTLLGSAALVTLNAGVSWADGVTPFVDCVASQQGTTDLAVRFGYANTGIPISIPFGDSNQIVPGIQFQGQPTVFDTGVYPDVMQAQFNSAAFESIEWELNGQNAIATIDSLGCSAGATGPVTAVTATTATITGTVTPDETATSSQFDYGTTGSYGSSTPAVAAVGYAPQAASAQLTGLTPDTTYHYRLDASTANLSTPGADGTFRTAPAPAMLSLEQHLAQADPRVGSTDAATFTVTNLDTTNPATDVHVTEIVPPDATAKLSASSASCALDSEGRVACSVGDLAPGASSTVTIALRLTQSRRLTSVAVATADQPNVEPVTALATARVRS